MEYGVPLDCPPAGLHVPPEFEGRFRYDADRRRLVFVGFMSRAEFDALSRLSPDWPYRRAVEELFRSSASDGAPPRWGLRRLLATVSGMS